MATPKQIEANRLNAQRSTGPKSEEGRRASSMNAFKSGLDSESQTVPGESAEEFAAYRTRGVGQCLEPRLFTRAGRVPAAVRRGIEVLAAGETRRQRLWRP